MQHPFLVPVWAFLVFVMATVTKLVGVSFNVVKQCHYKEHAMRLKVYRRSGDSDAGLSLTRLLP